jgi:hypothetical protein
MKFVACTLSLADTCASAMTRSPVPVNPRWQTLDAWSAATLGAAIAIVVFWLVGRSK